VSTQPAVLVSAATCDCTAAHRDAFAVAPGDCCTRSPLLLKEAKRHDYATRANGKPLAATLVDNRRAFYNALNFLTYHTTGGLLAVCTSLLLRSADVCAVVAAIVVCMSCCGSFRWPNTNLHQLVGSHGVQVRYCSSPVHCDGVLCERAGLPRSTRSGIGALQYNHEQPRTSQTSRTRTHQLVLASEPARHHTVDGECDRACSLRTLALYALSAPSPTH